MSDKDKIYELFRRNEHKLDEKPSRRAWERLDARLDRHDARRVTPGWFKYGGMVAAVLILVVTASLLTMNTQMQNDQFASLEKSDMMENPLLDFETVGNDDSYLRIVAYQKEYKNRSGRITERTMAGNLKPRGTNSPKANSAIQDMMPTDTDDVIAANDIADKITNNGEIAEIPLYNSEEKERIAQNTPIADKADLSKEKVEKETEEAEVAEKSEAKKLIAAADIPTPAVAEVAAAPAMEEPTAPSLPGAAGGNADYAAGMKEESRAAKSKDEIMEEEGISYDMNDEDSNYAGMEKKEELALNSFEWMLGNWKGNVNGSESVEKWTKIDAATYKGKGTLKAGGVTLFSEKLELKKTKVGTYLTVSLDKKNKRVAYRMTSNEGGTIVFENRSVGYPQKIVVKKNSNNSFSMTMQNGDTNSLDNKQIEYLENRNNINGEKLIRSLKKSE